jgi:hypothetical protein
MFCCQTFENTVASAGERGLAILVERTPDGIGFNLQSRGVAYEDIGKLRPVPEQDVIINVSRDVMIRYCPWCGRRLQELVQLAPELFAELARTHEPLLSARI